MSKKIAILLVGLFAVLTAVYIMITALTMGFTTREKTMCMYAMLHQVPIRAPKHIQEFQVIP